MLYLLNIYIPINICIISISYTYAQSQLMGSNPPLNELSARQLGFHPMSRKRGLGAPENLYGFHQSKPNPLCIYMYICVYIYIYVSSSEVGKFGRAKRDSAIVHYFPEKSWLR